MSGIFSFVIYPSGVLISVTLYFPNGTWVIAWPSEFVSTVVWYSSELFKVNLIEEGAEDAGGPYSEVLSDICDELQS